MFHFRAWGAVLALVAVSISAAQNSTPGKIDGKADEILRKLTAQFQSAQTAEVDLRLTVKLTTPPQELVADYSLALARPNKFALILKQGDLGASAMSDGTTAVTHLPKLNVYSTQPAPKDISAIESDPNSPAGDSMGSMAFIAALFSERPYQPLLAGVLEAKFSGAEKIGELEVNRLRFKQEGLDWSLLTTTGDKPAIRRIEVELPQMRMSMDFSSWRFNLEFAANHFKFQPPPGARKVDSVYESKDEEGEDSDLVGEPVPGLKLALLEGGSIDMASLKGKVAILLFWAGEADHCVQALRAVSELAASNKGALFFGINVDPEPKKGKIRDFLARNKLSLKTALDPDQTAIDKFEVDGVPMTFLINRAGEVHKAYLGYHSTFKTVVGQQVDLLLGKSGR